MIDGITLRYWQSGSGVPPLHKDVLEETETRVASEQGHFLGLGERENLACAVAIQPVAARLGMKGHPSPFFGFIVNFQLAIPAVCLFRAC
jgi:hypothetical protein